MSNSDGAADTQALAEELEATMMMTNIAAISLRCIDSNDELIRPLTKIGADPESLAAFQERFGDKAGTGKDASVRARIIFWKNYGDAIDARIGELTRGA